MTRAPSTDRTEERIDPIEPSSGNCDTSPMMAVVMGMPPWAQIRSLELSRGPSCPAVRAECGCGNENLREAPETLLLIGPWS
eukprot:7608216-Alexandrium_andersonii.AAC.1